MNFECGFSNSTTSLALAETPPSIAANLHSLRYWLYSKELRYYENVQWIFLFTKSQLETVRAVQK